MKKIILSVVLILLCIAAVPVVSLLIGKAAVETGGVVPGGSVLVVDPPEMASEGIAVEDSVMKRLRQLTEVNLVMLQSANCNEIKNAQSRSIDCDAQTLFPFAYEGMRSVKQLEAVLTDCYLPEQQQALYRYTDRLETYSAISQRGGQPYFSDKIYFKPNGRYVMNQYHITVTAVEQDKIVFTVRLRFYYDDAAPEYSVFPEIRTLHCTAKRSAGKWKLAQIYTGDSKQDADIRLDIKAYEQGKGK